MGQVMMLKKFEELIDNYLNWKDEALGKCFETCGALLYVDGHGGIDGLGTSEGAKENLRSVLAMSNLQLSMAFLNFSIGLD
jgi:hypothetical protein